MDFGDYWHIFFISMVPIVECRGSIPVGIVDNGLPWSTVLAVAIVGNILPVPFLLLGLERTVKILSHIKVFAWFFDWLFERTRRRGIVVDKYKRVGLMLFVSIPFPGTGAWTGTAAACVFGIPFRHALLSIVAGVIIAGTIVTALSLLGWAGFAVAAALLIVLLALGIWKL